MNKTLCLLYHRILPVSNDIYNISVSIEHFDEQIKYLSEHYDIIRFESNWANSNEDKIVITFDDGYWDNYVYALPILEKYHVPATFFISTGNLGKKEEFWWDALATLLTEDKEYPIKFTLEDEYYHYTWSTKTLDHRRELVKTLRWLLRFDPSIERREDWLMQLRKWADVGKKATGKNRVLDINELKALASSPYVSIGAHTNSHISLGCLNQQRQKEEIEGSITILENILDRKINIFAYPFGGAMDYNQNTMDICKNFNVIKAATTRSGVYGNALNEYSIPRKIIRDSDIDEYILTIRNCW